MTNIGKTFETNLQEAMKLTCFFYRLRDSSSGWGGQAADSKARFTTTNACDFITHYEGNLFMIEAKSTALKSLPYTNIKPSQIKGFKKYLAEPFPNIYPVFIVEFRAVNETYIIHAKKVIEHMEKGERKSLELDFFKEHGQLMTIMPKKKKLLNISEAFDFINAGPVKG